MDPETFASDRKATLEAADEELRPFVEDALHALLAGDPDWEQDLVVAASTLWIDTFEEEADGGRRGLALARFRRDLKSSLAKTAEPEMDVPEYRIDQLTYWLSGYTVNSATVAGAFSRGVKFKRWTTMHDDAVREIHVAADGQIVPIGGTFSVGGEELSYPGEPVGDPEIWIQCRCLAQPASKTGDAMSGTTYTIGPEDDVEDNPDIVVGSDVIRAAAAPPGLVDDDPDVDEDDLIDDEIGEDEEEITEIPVHGVLAPEGVPTGDGRQFAIGALSTRDLPIPLRYETVSTHGGMTSDVVTIGRVDKAWRDDATDMWRYEGAVVLSMEFAQEAIDGMVNGTVRGVSIDGDQAEIEIPDWAAAMFEDVPEGDEDAEDVEDDGPDPDMLEEMFNPSPQIFRKMRVAGLTIVPIPAFQEAYIALGHEFQEDLSPEERDAQVAALQACGCMDDWAVVDLSASPEDNARAAIEAAVFRDVPQEERDRRAEDGTAMPDGSYPIADCEDLQNAIQAIGRASDPEATKRHIKKRAAALDCPDVEIPEDWSVQAAAFAPGTHDGPGWITHPIPTQRIRNYWVRGEGAAKIRWGEPGDFNRCRKQLAKYVQNPDWLAGLCANMHKEALGFWPAQHHGSRVITASASTLRSPVARLVEPEHEVYPAEWFTEPTLDRAYPLKIDRETRRVHGYISEWGVCHVGMTGMCQEVPQSTSGYAYFLKGVIDTTEGEVFVGNLTWGGHASRYSSMAKASEFYDKPDAVRAFVNVGENAYGVWFAGIIPPDVTDEDITKMRAIGAVSGDWREVRGELELIGVPVVNTPGLPVRQLAASAGRQTVMIGAGALKPEVAPARTATFTLQMDPETVAGIARTAVAEYRHQEKLEARLEPARAKVRERRLTAARARTERG